MKVIVSDIEVTEREVDLPDECPNCHADLKRECAIKLWDFQDQGRVGTFQEDGELGDFGSSQDGETFLVGHEYQCVSCGHTLVQGELDIKAVDRGP